MSHKLRSICLAMAAVVLATAVAACKEQCLTDPATSEASVRACPLFLPLAYDRHLSMPSGVDNLLTLHHGIVCAEDRFVGTRWFSERTLLRKIGGATCRAAKYYALDLPLDHFPLALVHEFYGHGARLREFRAGPVTYSFELPPPYGSGEGTTRCFCSVSVSEALAVHVAGLGAQSLLHQALAARWVERGQINYREADVYYLSFLSYFFYIQDTKSVLEDNSSGHDIAQYLSLINSTAGIDDDDKLLMGADDLKTWNLVNLANPFLLYALFARYKTYLWDGNTSTRFPMLGFKGVSYLPCFAMELTPFGPEYHMDNLFRVRARVFIADLHIGDQTFHKSWGGIGLRARNIYARDRLSFDANLDLWRQPELDIRREPATSKGRGLGGGFSIRTYSDLSHSPHPISLLVEVGYKSRGFVEGYPLDSSPILMLGLAFKE